MSVQSLLVGRSIYIRRLEQDDLERCHAWINNPLLFSIMGVFGPRSKAEQQSWYDSISQSRNNLVFAICERNTERHIGNLSLFDINLMHRNAGLTVFIADKDKQGRGLGSEAVSLLCAYAFDYLNLNRVYCKTDNEVAGKLYQRLGFEKEGILRQHSFYCGKYIDKISYGLLKAEFKAAH